MQLEDFSNLIIKHNNMVDCVYFAVSVVFQPVKDLFCLTIVLSF